MQTTEVKLFDSILRRLRVVFSLFSFGNKLKRHNVDIVHANPSLLLNAILREGLFILVTKMYKKKVLVFFHGWNKSFEKKMGKRGYLLMLFKKIYGNSDVFIVLASEFKQKLIDWGFKQKIYIETTSIDDELIKGVDLNKKFKISMNHSIRILFLSRIVKEKGIYETIEAVNILSRKNKNISLIIAGDGAQLDHCREYVKRESIKNIDFVGYVFGKQKQDAFLKADIYVFPSYYGEGLPISVLEAMAFGLPVVTRNVGGLKDFFENGKHGFVTESKSPKVFASLLEKLITNKSLRHTISLFNYKYAQENFMASAVTKRIETVYLDLMRS